MTEQLTSAVLPRRAPRLVTYDAVAHSLRWDEVIGALRAGHGRPRPELGDLLLGPREALLIDRAAYVAGVGYAVKVETVIPGNVAGGLPTVQGMVLLYDPIDGSVRAVIESRLITAFKTAADSVLAAQLLARRDSRRLLIAGAGPVAASLARAYWAGFGGLDSITVWARRSEQAEVLVASLADLPVQVRVSENLRTAAQDADIISCATSAREPILFGGWIQPGTHVDLIGAFTPDMREADDALMAKSRIYVDLRETTIDVIGELLQPIASGAITRDDILGDLYDLVAEVAPARVTTDEITVFKNGGGAHLDLMVAAHVVNLLDPTTQGA